jgi:hypothetical protein
VASVDVIHGDIDEIRWLDDRLTQNDRDKITERLERALWDAFDETTKRTTTTTPSRARRRSRS